MTPSEALNLLLGAGGIAFVAGIYKVVKDYREGTWLRQDHAVADLERWRAKADDSREWEAAQHAWWRYWAGRLEYVILTKLGAESLPEKEPYPARPQSASRETP